MIKRLFKTIFSSLTYKEKKKQHFQIPEINETESEESQDQSSGEKLSSRKRSYGIRKPKPISDAKKQDEEDNDSEASDRSSDTVSSNIEENIKFIEKAFNYPDNKDLVIRQISIAGKYKAFIFFLEGMADRITINNSIIKPLLNGSKFEEVPGHNLLDYIFESVLELNQVRKIKTQSEAITEVLSGNTALYINNFEFYLTGETKGYEKRGVEKPLVEGVVKGPQEAFNENLRTNTTLIRRIIKNKDLTTEFISIGKRNNSMCAVMYLKDLANEAIVKEVKRRIEGIDTDLMMGDGFLEQFIDGNPYSIIPTVLSTERPDRTVSHIMEGKVAIIADGTPFSLIVPITVADLLHTSEDTSLRWQYGTLLRFIRIFAIFAATLLPGIYVAITTFHREMIPTDLMIAIAIARENVPFPTIIELLLMAVSFELIREAGIRIPGIIGNTIGIIGALILGQAAVQANLVSPVLIIIIAFSGLGSFAIPDFNLSFGAIIMRFFYIFTGATLGFFGISLGLLVSLAHLVQIKSFGVPMLSTIAPKTRRSNDYILRLPMWMQEFRPDYVNPKDIRRQPDISRKWVKSKKKATTSEDNKEGNDKD